MDRPAHRLAVSFAVGESQAGSVRILALVEYLGERCKDPVLDGGIDAAASVADFQHEPGNLQTRFADGTDGDLSPAGKLAGITDQVREHPRQFITVGVHRRHALCTVDGQGVSVLGGRRIHSSTDFRDQRDNVEFLQVQFKLPQLDPLRVDNVFDQPLKTLTGEVDGPEVIALLGAERGVCKQLAVALYRGQRGFQVVTDRGDEAGLRVARFQEFTDLAFEYVVGFQQLGRPFPDSRVQLAIQFEDFGVPVANLPQHPAERRGQDANLITTGRSQHLFGPSNRLDPVWRIHMRARVGNRQRDLAHAVKRSRDHQRTNHGHGNRYSRDYPGQSVEWGKLPVEIGDNFFLELSTPDRK